MNRFKPARQIFFLLIFVAFLLRLALLFRPEDLFHARPIIEDAYYSLSVARSLAYGHGLTVDGVHLTNGIQPLIVFLYAPFYFFFTDETALRLCLLLCVMIEFTLAYLCVILVRSSYKKAKENAPGTHAAYFSGILFLWTYSSTVYTLNGLETGLSAVFVLASTLYYLKKFLSQPDQVSLKENFLLGFMLGLMILARIDTVFFVLVILGYHITINRRETIGKRFIQTSIIGGIASMISFPWWWYNLHYFGHFVPTSGLSQSQLIPVGENITALIQLIINSFLFIGYIPYKRSLGVIHSMLITAIIFSTLIIMVVPTIRSQANEVVQSIKKNWKLKYVVLPTVFSLAMIVYYTVAFGAPHFLARYLFVFHVLVISFASILLTELWQYYSNNYPHVARTVAIIFSSIVLFVFAYTYRWNFQPSIAQQNDFLQISKWIQRHTSPTETVGMGQSGTAGYFNTNVTNLDGKVNFNLVRARWSNNSCAYMESARFDYLIDWQKFFDDLSLCRVLENYKRIDSVGRFIVYKRMR